MSQPPSATPGFRDLQLIEPVLQALDAVGYETPSPIQALTIPYMLQGRDVLGQAQTGTGKTAAFALPIVSRIDLARNEPQALVLAPTRELAIQVAESFQRYAAFLSGFHVLPIYGGAEYGSQIRPLKRGVHVVVGTPGRVMDHMRRGTLKLDALSCLVLDEADEMLRMGFIDDVKWILEQSPAGRQIALFSATMPNEIKRIAQRHLREPAEVTIKEKTTTAATIRQRYWLVSGFHKLDALTRILEGESFDGVLIFVRTKTETVDLAEKLQARGYTAAALNGDVPQKQRERTVDNFKAGKLDILVATDVAARGLDVERVSLVVNYDIPYDTESYVHRIGRTGRAGRSGDAILFVAPRERNMLRNIERATRQPIELMELPSSEAVNDKRLAEFFQRITDTLATEEWREYHTILQRYQTEHNIPPLDLAAALAKLLHGPSPLLLKAETRRREEPRPESGGKGRRDAGDSRPPRERPARRSHDSDVDMETFRVEVGAQQQIKPGNLVGAIANEIGLDSEFIGRINIYDDYSTIDLPAGMPKEVMNTLKKVWVGGAQLRISRLKAHAEGGSRYGAARDAGDYDDARPAKPRRTGGGRDDARPAKPRPGGGRDDARPAKPRHGGGRDDARPAKPRPGGGRDDTRPAKPRHADKRADKRTDKPADKRTDKHKKKFSKDQPLAIDKRKKKKKDRQRD